MEKLFSGLLEKISGYGQNRINPSQHLLKEAKLPCVGLAWNLLHFSSPIPVQILGKHLGGYSEWHLLHAQVSLSLSPQYLGMS